MMDQFEVLYRMPWRSDRTKRCSSCFYGLAFKHTLGVGRRSVTSKRARPIATPRRIARAWNSILLAVETALAAAEAEQSGLTRRVDDFLARAAVTFGNDTDEYLTREALDSQHQDLFDNEISNGQRRLQELALTISHFKFLKTAILSRFPDFKPPAANKQPAQLSPVDHE